MRKILVTTVVALLGFIGWEVAANAGLFSRTGPVIAILAGDLFQGEAEGHLGGAGTLTIQSRSKPELSCHGQFTSSAELGGAGELQCSDGANATFSFHRLTLAQGYGTGSTSRGPMSFTYGLSLNESAPYLKLPAGKILRQDGEKLLLQDVRPAISATPAQPGASTALAETTPDKLLSAATFIVISGLKGERNLQSNDPVKFAKLIESAILPLFDFRHMTQLSMARNWHRATPEQQSALTAEFRKMLVRTYSSVLANYHDQAIEYQATRIAAGEIAATVKSIVQQAGRQRLNIDYEMEKTAAGWRIYNVRMAGISLITSYQPAFAKTIRDSGIDGLIRSLADNNRQADAGLVSQPTGARMLLFLYALMPNVFSNRE